MMSNVCFTLRLAHVYQGLKWDFIFDYRCLRKFLLLLLKYNSVVLPDASLTKLLGSPGRPIQRLWTFPSRAGWQKAGK